MLPINSHSVRNTAVLTLLFYLLLSALADEAAATDVAAQAIDLQGHRGARGLLPENTIPGFQRALELGVTTLEMDVAINAEGHAVLSHEPWMSAKICVHPDGRKVTEEEEKSLNIYGMSDEQVAGFDCGSRGHPDFPRQQARPLSKPLLSEVLQAFASPSSASGQPSVRFNIEIKSRPDGDGVFHPEVGEFAQILYGELREYGALERTTVQSFDPRALEAMHGLDPDLSIALLISDSHNLEQNLALLSFVPEIYSPNYKLVDEGLIRAAHARNIQVIPWTVNEAETMRELLDMGVDGLITDYPDIAIEVLSENETQAKPDW
jgi:glycerophosphoryl diester phosphodiesterase